MCNFKSAIVLPDSIYCPLDEDSHEVMLWELGIKDNTKTPNFVRVEMVFKYIDANDFGCNTGDWKLHIDQDTLPKWFNYDKTEAEMKKKLQEVFDKRFVINRHIPVIYGGRWFIKDGIVDAVTGNSVLERVEGNSNIGRLEKLSVIKVLVGNSIVEAMTGHSQILTMRNNSKVGTMYDYTKVVRMYDNSMIGRMDYWSTVDTMRNRSKVNMLAGRSVVRIANDLSQICNIEQQAIVIRDPENKTRTSDTEVVIKSLGIDTI